MTEETTGKPPARPASIADVARAAAVSVPTVSRVLTGAARVSPERRHRVLTAIGDLDYRPSAAARALVSGRPSAVGILTSNTSIYGYSTTVGGLEAAARDAGFSVLISVVEGHQEHEASLAIDTILRQPLAGLAVLKFDPSGVAAVAALPTQVPAVVVSGELDDGLPQATINEHRGGASVVEHLLGLGHPTVHHVSVPPSRAEDGRTTGWRTALEAAGAPVPAILPATWDPRSGVAIGRRIAADPGITAVFCGNDEIAMGVVAGLIDAGVRVPEDVSVVGFDDHPLAALWRPAITTVTQDFDDLGRRAFGLLAGAINGGRSALPSRSVAEPTLVVRSSTAVHRARHVR